MLVLGFPDFAEHVPEPQVRQLPSLQALSQQWPSVEQMPLPHSFPAAQVVPGAFLEMQLTPLQYWPVAQSESVPQARRHWPLVGLHV
jgi:hypothetical protein